MRYESKKRDLFSKYTSKPQEEFAFSKRVQDKNLWPKEEAFDILHIGANIEHSNNLRMSHLNAQSHSRLQHKSTSTTVNNRKAWEESNLNIMSNLNKENENRSKSRKKENNVLSKIIFGKNEDKKKNNKQLESVMNMNAVNSLLNKINVASERRTSGQMEEKLKELINWGNDNNNINKKKGDNECNKNFDIYQSSISPKNFSIKKYKSNFVKTENKLYNTIKLDNDSIELQSKNNFEYDKEGNNKELLNLQFSTSMKNDNTFTGKIFPQVFSRTKTQQCFSNKKPERYISSNSNVSEQVGSVKISKNSSPKIEEQSPNPQRTNLLSSVVQPLNQFSFPKMTSPYKSPSNKNKQRPYSHIHKKSLPFNSKENSISFNNGNNDDNCIKSLIGNNLVVSPRAHSKNKEERNKSKKGTNQLAMLSFNYNTNNQKQQYFSKMALMEEDKFKRIMKVVDEIEQEKENLLKKQKQINEAKSMGRGIKFFHNCRTINVIKNNENISKSNSNINKLSSTYIKTEKLDLENLDSENDVPSSSRSRKSLSVISFCILSSYNQSLVGLTEVELFDINGKPIRICECSTNGKENLNTVSNENNSIKNIFNGVKYTTDENNMWITKFTKDLRIDIYVDSEINLGSIVIWNYNGKDISIGVKDVEIYKRNNLIWKGTLPKGCNLNTIDFSTKINFSIYSSKDLEDIMSKNSNESKFLSARKSFYSSISSLNSARNKNSNNTSEINNNVNNSYEKNALRTSIGKKSSFESISQQSKPNPNVIICNKIKIVLTSNYGHRKFIGLTGIQFFDEEGELINHEDASTIGAMPKDFRTYYDNDDMRIFENVFSGINKTINENQMWLTLIKPNEPLPYFELFFEEPIKISCIKIYNYNSPNDLDKCTKTIDLYLDDHLPICSLHSSITLFKGVGEKNVDYSQDITFPIKKFQFSEEELEPLKKAKYSSFLYNQCYETPYLPVGFVIRFSLLSSYGNSDMIGLDKIEIYDQLGRSILLRYRRDYKIVYNNDYSEEEETFIENGAKRELNQLKTSTNSSNKQNKNSGPFAMKYSNIAQKGKENYPVNNIYFIFTHPVCISYMILHNTLSNNNHGVKDIKIFSDDQVIFEGILNQYDEKKTLILFTCEMSLTKGLDEKLLSQPIVKRSSSEVKTEKYISLDLYK